MKTNDIENFADYLSSLSKDLNDSGFQATAVDVNAASKVIKEALDLMILEGVDLSKLSWDGLLPL